MACFSMPSRLRATFGAPWQLQLPSSGMAICTATHPVPLGALLAGLYGLALGWLRVVTGGIGLPVIAHIAADATIFTIAARSGLL